MKKLIYPILACSVFALDLIYWLLLRNNPLEVRSYYVHFFGIMIIYCCGLTTYGVLKKAVSWWPVLTLCGLVLQFFLAFYLFSYIFAP